MLDLNRVEKWSNLLHKRWKLHQRNLTIVPILELKHVMGIYPIVDLARDKLHSSLFTPSFAMKKRIVAFTSSSSKMFSKDQCNNIFWLQLKALRNKLECWLIDDTFAGSSFWPTCKC